MEIVKVINKSDFPLPKRQTEGSSGFDLYANIKEELEILPGTIYAIPTGIFLEIPKGLEAQVRARSGLALKEGICLVNGIGTIDSDYQGEIKVILTTLSKNKTLIKPGQRIAQLVFIPVVIPKLVEVKEFAYQTQRSSGGFGHTG